MLSTKLSVEVLLEPCYRNVGMARHCNCLTFTSSRAGLDKVLEVIVIDVVCSAEQLAIT